MLKFCKTCKCVRTAEDLGVVSPVTKADELFCSKYPPQVGSQAVKSILTTSHGFVEKWDEYTDQPVCLPACNDGQGYRGMSCWEAGDKNTAELLVTVDELEVLYTLMSDAPISWKLRNADLYDHCRVTLVAIRSQA